MKKFCVSLLVALGFAVSVSGQSSENLFKGAAPVTRVDLTVANPQWAPFFHGVASGDPLEDRVIIWTRVTPDDLTTPSVTVQWRVATDPALTKVVRNGSTTTNPARDYTVKVDVTGLQPGTTYYYGFTALGRNSLTGKTKTTPQSDLARHLKLAVVSCSNYQAGYFNAYQRLAERRDLDAVIHLGDYIYEYAQGRYGDTSIFRARPLQPATEILTLADYRTRYSLYRLDTSLSRVHQQHPFITVWDDHESANNAYTDGAENHQPNEGDWNARKAISKQVYYEWLPVRGEPNQPLYRKISYGNLVDLFMLDTRLEGREKQVTSVSDPVLLDTARTLLGRTQRQWLFDNLLRSTARWKVLGQQVMMAELNVGWGALLLGAADPNFTFDNIEGSFLDIWDGYPAERSKILQFLKNNRINNTIVLTGDVHAAFAYDVPEKPNVLTFINIPGLGTAPAYSPSPLYNPATGAGSVAVEFITPSITSANFDENLPGGTPVALALQRQINTPIVPFPGASLGNPNPHLKYTDLVQNGYYVIDIKPDSAQANYYFSDILRISNTERTGEAWYTRNGENRLRKAAAPSPAKAILDVPAPANPPMVTSVKEIAPRDRKFVLLSVYPNPFQETNIVQYSLTERARLNISLYDLSGKLLRVLREENAAAGVYNLQLDATNLAPGAYLYKFVVDGQIYTSKIVVERP